MFAAHNAFRKQPSGSTFNPDDKDDNITLSNGNLKAVASGQGSVRGTLSKSTTGKWYCEFKAGGVYNGWSVGLANSSADISYYPGHDNNGIGYFANGLIIKNEKILFDTEAPIYTGDIISIAYDAGAGTIAFRHNNSLKYTASGGDVPANALFIIAGFYFLAANGTTLNTGASAFAYTPPSGFSAWG